MALTLQEAAKLSNDILLIGVVETIIKESPVLKRLPFIEIVGNGLTYNQEQTLPEANFYDVGEEWAESTPTFVQKTAQLKILGGDADIDNFLISTRSNINDLEATIVELKAKAVRMKFEETFIKGDSSANPKEFDGIDKLCSDEQVVSMGTDGDYLTLEKLDELIDRIKGGKPDMLLMSRRSRRALNALARATGNLMVDRDEFGEMVEFYDGIPIGVSDYIPDNEVVGSSTDCSTIYAIKFGEDGVCGLTSPGGLKVEMSPIGAHGYKLLIRTGLSDPIELLWSRGGSPRSGGLL